MNIAVHKGRQKMIVWKPVDANDQEQRRDTNDFYGHKAQTFTLYKGVTSNSDWQRVSLTSKSQIFYKNLRDGVFISNLSVIWCALEYV